MTDVPSARRMARACLGGSGARWRHVAAVGSLAESLPSAPEVVRSAAWLHDVGYASDAARTGFHPLDGAKYLDELGWPAEVVALVAHHSGALVEAEERGLRHELERWPVPNWDLLDLVNYCDLTTGPTGARVSVTARLDEILGRYDTGDPVHRAVSRSAPALVDSVRRAEAWLASADVHGV